MNVIYNIFERFGLFLFGRLSFCALIGAIIGAIVAIFLTIYQLFHPDPISGQEMLVLGLMLGLFALLAVLLVVGVLMNYGAANILPATTLNAILTSVITVFISYKIGEPFSNFLIGIVVGAVVGTLLCRFCDITDPKRIVK